MTSHNKLLLADNELNVQHQTRQPILPIDLCDAEAVQKAVNEANPDLVMHLEAEAMWTIPFLDLVPLFKSI